MPSDFQFLGKQETLYAFESRGVEDWAIFCGSRFIMKGQGISELEKFLDMIARSGTMAIYTLKVYEGLPDGAKINSKTPDDGSFNFKLFSLDGSPGQLSGIIQRHYADPAMEKLLAELNDVKQRLAGMEAEEIEDDSPDLMGEITQALIGMLHEPRKLNEFISAFTGRVSPGSYFAPPSRVGSLPETTQPLTSNESLERIGSAIEVIAKVDPKIVDHLEKLAEVAQQNPHKFKNLVAMIEFL